MSAQSSNALQRQSISSVVVDSVNGNDGTAARYGGSAKTLTRAKALALSGDTIFVLPGTYVENDLLKDGVNWHFLPGVIIQVATPQDSGNAYGIFDDRSVGASVSCKITGAAKLSYDASSSNTNDKGPVVITNSGSSISFQVDEIVVLDGTIARAAIYIKNCTNFLGEIGKIADGGLGSCGGIYWENGDCEIAVKKIDVGGNAVWGNDIGGTPDTNLFVQADILRNTTGSTVYLSGDAANPNFRMWVNAKLITGHGGSSIVTAFTGGKLYVTAEKIEDTIGAVNGAISTSGAAQMWITTQKISSPSRWLTCQNTWTGQVYLSVQHYDDPSSSITTGWNIDGTGKILLQGGTAKVMNGRGIDQISTAVIRVESVSIDTSNTNNAANVPVRVAGASGVILSNCTLVSGALAKCVLGTAAGKTIKNYGSKANQAVDAVNVTVQVDAITVDANVA